jgi:hypothetical protein
MPSALRAAIRSARGSRPPGRRGLDLRPRTRPFPNSCRSGTRTRFADRRSSLPWCCGSSRRSCGASLRRRRSRPLWRSNSDFARSSRLAPRPRVITCYLRDLETPDAGENGVKFAFNPGPRSMIAVETQSHTRPEVELVLVREGNLPGGSITSPACCSLRLNHDDPRLFEPLRSAA